MTLRFVSKFSAWVNTDIDQRFETTRLSLEITKTSKEVEDEAKIRQQK